MKKILVVVDMQKDFIDGALGTPEAQAVLSSVTAKIKNFDGDIFYTRDTHGRDYLETLEGKNLPIPHCIEGTEGWEINEQVMKASEGKKVTIIDKPTFGSAELVERIFEQSITLAGDGKAEGNGEAVGGGIESVTLIGLCTDICVISNALNIKARLWETPIIVDSSCCAGVTPKSHENALDAMKMCQITIV